MRGGATARLLRILALKPDSHHLQLYLSCIRLASVGQYVMHAGEAEISVCRVLGEESCIADVGATAHGNS